MAKPPRRPTRSFRPRRPPRRSVAPSAIATPFSPSPDELPSPISLFQTPKAFATISRNVRNNERARKPAAAPQILRRLHARQAPLRPRASDLHPVRRAWPRVQLSASPRRLSEPSPPASRPNSPRDARLLHRRPAGRLLDAGRVRCGPASAPGLWSASGPDRRDVGTGEWLKRGTSPRAC